MAEHKVGRGCGSQENHHKQYGQQSAEQMESAFLNMKVKEKCVNMQGSILL